MKIINKKIKIGGYKGIQIFLDWKYLIKDRGFRKEEDQSQMVLGSFLKLIASIGLTILVLYDISLGNFILKEIIVPDRWSDGLVWLFIGFWIYSLYLNRDRDKYLDTLDLKALTKLRDKMEEGREPSEVEILDFVDADVLNILDDLISSNEESIYYKLMFELVQLNDVKQLLHRLGIENEDLLEQLKTLDLPVEGDKSFQINRLLFQSFVLGLEYDFSYVGEWVVFLKLALDEFDEVFKRMGVQKNTLLGVLEWSKAQAISNRYMKIWKYKASLKPKSTVNRSFTSAYTSTLNSYSKDLTLKVIKNGFQYAVSREDEIEELIRNLRQTKSAVLLRGEAGVGKTTILKSLAVKMVVEDVPREIRDMRLVEFDFQRAIAGAKSTNKLRGIIEKIFKEVEKAKNIILVIDDLDELVNIREEVAGEIVSTLSKAIESNRVKLVATSTRAGYAQSINPNKVLSNMFDIVEVDEPSAEIALQVLFDEQSEIEDKYSLKIQFDAIRAAVDLSIRYDTARVLPFKAIDALEDACVLSLEEGLENVSAKEVEKVISKDVGIKVGGLAQGEGEKLLKLEETMHQRVIGQDKAIDAVADALRRARAGLSSKNRPIASFLFFGPTGVGKTEVAKTLASVYFGSEKLVTRLDMSEFQEESNVNRLIGYKSGDDFIEGQLVKNVREHPFSLILLDEIEKANPRVLDLFLQVLDEGHITDGIGRKVDFKNTIIIATSNVGSSEIANALQLGKRYEETYRLANEELKKNLRIEFLNRFDKVIMFKPLTRVEVEKIADLMLKKLKYRLLEQGIDLNYSSKVLSQLVEVGYSPVYGARELNRMIQDRLETQIADLIVGGKLKSGQEVYFNSLEKFSIR